MVQEVTKMRDMNERPMCHRAEDLVTYLYGEAGAEAQDFQSHLQACDACRSEFAVFNQVHESLATWRNEALGTAPVVAPVAQAVVATPAPVQAARRLSALAALKEFFQVSPLWLRAATAFAAVLFCVMAVFVVVRETRPAVQIANDNSERKYTIADVDQAYQKGLKEAQPQPGTTEPKAPIALNVNNQDSATRRQPRKVRPKGL